MVGSNTDESILDLGQEAALEPLGRIDIPQYK